MFTQDTYLKRDRFIVMANIFMQQEIEQLCPMHKAFWTSWFGGSSLTRRQDNGDPTFPQPRELYQLTIPC